MQKSEAEVTPRKNYWKHGGGLCEGGLRERVLTEERRRHAIAKARGRFAFFESTEPPKGRLDRLSKEAFQAAKERGLVVFAWLKRLPENEPYGDVGYSYDDDFDINGMCAYVTPQTAAKYACD